MKKGYLYIVCTITGVILVRTVISIVPAGSRTGAYVFILSLVSAIFLGLVVWAWRKGKFN